jgi:cellulose synthase operon protein YhjQ
LVEPTAFQPAAEPAAQFDTQAVSPQPEFSNYAPPQPSWPGTVPAQAAPHAQPEVPVAKSEPAAPAVKPESYEAPISSWRQGIPVQQEQRENPSRPAWLTPERPETPSPAPAARPAEDTLQGSRDRLASRWYALRGVFDGGSVQPEAAPAAPPVRPPAVAVFSLAGGVGKTSLVATLGRALSSRGERVLLIDTAPYGLMPFFFGAHDQRPGVLRTFSPPGTSGDAPIQMVTIDPDALEPETATMEVMTSEISKYSRGVSRIIVDLATASGATTRRVLRMSPLVLVPMVPDMNSVVSVSSIDSFFQHNINPNSKQVMPFYILNQFDSSLPLHLDIREILREQLGDRLLPLALRRTPVVSEALAEGMTVMDYAPNSTLAEDFANLAGWVKSQSAPASSAYRGVRWSER